MEGLPGYAYDINSNFLVMRFKIFLISLFSPFFFNKHEL